MLSAVVLFTNAGFDVTELNPFVYSLSWPTLHLVPAAAVLLAGAAGFLAPPQLPASVPSRPTTERARARHPEKATTK